MTVEGWSSSGRPGRKESEVELGADGVKRSATGNESERDGLSRNLWGLIYLESLR